MAVIDAVHLVDLVLAHAVVKHLVVVVQQDHHLKIQMILCLDNQQFQPLCPISEKKIELNVLML